MLTHNFIRRLIIAGMILLASCQPQGSTQLAPANTTDAEIATPIPTNTNIPTPTATPVPLAPMDDFFKGVWFTNWTGGPGYQTQQADYVLENIIKPLGATWIGVQSNCQIEFANPSSDCLDQFSASDSELSHVVNLAHKIGLRVMMMPLVINTSDNKWVADLDYGNDKQAWETYFATYTKHLIHYAQLAESLHVDLFVIAGEQTIAQRREQDWRKMIAEVRNVYHGPITYEAFGRTYTQVKWWDAVDYIGINAYLQSADSTSLYPTFTEIHRNWENIAKEMSDFSKKWNKPIIITEIGWFSIQGIACYCYSNVRLDTKEQSLEYRATIDVFKNQPWLKGIFYYDYQTIPTQGGMGSVDFNPHGKPAELYLQEFYSGLPAPTFTPTPTDSPITSEKRIFNDEMQNGSKLFSQNGKIVDDPLGKRGKVIRIDVKQYNEGVDILLPGWDTLDFSWLEFYIYAPNLEPNLQFRINSRTVFARSYMDHEPLLDGNWHRIRIPLTYVAPSGVILGHLKLIHEWPGQPPPLTFYVDDIRLIR